MSFANLLIADGEPMVRLDLRNLLVHSGHTVVGEVSTGEEALALSRALRPDAVILDIELGRKVSGLEVARALSGERIAPVVVLTGRANPEVLAEANAAGVLAFLSKPFRGEDLLPAIAVARARFGELVALERELRRLNEHVEARKLVGRAKAILMERHGLQEREAFRRIQAQSLTTGKPAHEIARAIITASEIAGT
jgi:response regulator NasT